MTTAGRTVALRVVRIALAISVVLSPLLLAPPSVAFADSGVCAVPGKDGPGGTLSGIVNTYYPGISSASAGATSIAVGAGSGAATPIAAGDLLLVIQMQDAFIDSTNTDAYGDGVAGAPASGWSNPNNVGRYEYVVATGAVSGGSVPIRGAGAGSGIIYAYTAAAANATDGQRTFQIIRVPQYSSATLSSGLTALAWNGSVGGVLALDVAGSLSLGGTVSVDAMGFRGGGGRQLGGGGGFQNPEYVSLSTGIPNGAKGEGIAGTPILVYDGTAVVNTGAEGYPNGAMARGAPGNAGGGGTDGQLNNDQNSGGGGGGQRRHRRAGRPHLEYHPRPRRTWRRSVQPCGAGPAGPGRRRRGRDAQQHAWRRSRCERRCRRRHGHDPRRHSQRHRNDHRQRRYRRRPAQ